MDLVLIITTVMLPVVVGMLLKSEEEDRKEKGYSYKEMQSDGYEVYKYGNFDYCYKRS